MLLEGLEPLTTSSRLLLQSWGSLEFKASRLGPSGPYSASGTYPLTPSPCLPLYLSGIYRISALCSCLERMSRTTSPHYAFLHRPPLFPRNPAKPNPLQNSHLCLKMNAFFVCLGLLYKGLSQSGIRGGLGLFCCHG